MNTMIIFPAMLLSHMAPDCGIKVPDKLDEYKSEEYPHWHVFCYLHLGRPVNTSDIDYNSDIIGKMSREEVMSLTWEGFRQAGCRLDEPNELV